MCSTCFLFCKRSLQQSDDDLRTPESIVCALRSKVAELQDTSHHCKEGNETTLLHTALFLGQQMLCDMAVTFPMLYDKYLVSKRRDDAPLPGSGFCRESIW